MKLLFYILHFCIFGQIERMATLFSCCGNEEKDDVLEKESILKDVNTLARKSQALYRLSRA